MRPVRCRWRKTEFAMIAEKSLRIAVIEDYALTRRGIVATVQEWPYTLEVLEAEDGVDYAERCADWGHVHLALVDVRMPRRDGYETMRWMHKHQPRTKALAITYDPAPAVVRKALQCHACTVLGKGVGLQELHRAMNAVMSTGYYVNQYVSRDLLRTVEAEGERPAERWGTLCPREQELLLLYVSEGVRDLAEVATRLGIALHTAETHRRNGYKKLGIHGKDELMRLVLLNGLRES